MELTVVELEAEQRRLVARIQELQEELGALQARLGEVARALEKSPKARTLSCQFKLVAGPEPATAAPIALRAVPLAQPERPAAPFDRLRQAGRGTGLFASAESGDRREAELWLRAGPDRLAAIEETPHPEFRAGVFTQAESGLALLPVLVRVGPDEESETVYEAWVNESPAGLADTLAQLGTQENLRVCVYGDDGRLAREFRVPNPLRAFAREAQALTAGQRLASADEFHRARTAVYNQYPNLRAFWKALKT